jgi:hypothetical protein
LHPTRRKELALELALELYLDHKHGAMGGDGRSLGLGQVVRCEMQRRDSDRLLFEREQRRVGGGLFELRAENGAGGGQEIKSHKSGAQIKTIYS